ncbi:Cyclin-U4-1 [Rhynchospora pubera]|uniref:Cyclin n=1 Tax=Rhynchospora pubera TaxID=906938 RepID=A0AAV8DPN8_9POAL|nr:Cyclin-U4-1 [Rhynchospora pubera]
MPISNTSSSKFASKLASILSSLLERTANKNDSTILTKTKHSPFRGENKPSITIRAYLERIIRYTDCSPCCFLVAYIYLDRLALNCPETVINSFSVHRLLITSVMVAAKFMDDLHYSNAYYARVGGIEVSEMNYLELELLFGLQFELNVSPNQFNSYCTMLEAEMCLESVSPISKLQCFSSQEKHEEENGEKPKIQVQTEVKISTC